MIDIEKNTILSEVATYYSGNWYNMVKIRVESIGMEKKVKCCALSNYAKSSTPEMNFL